MMYERVHEADLLQWLTAKDEGIVRKTMLSDEAYLTHLALQTNNVLVCIENTDVDEYTMEAYLPRRKKPCIVAVISLKPDVDVKDALDEAIDIAYRKVFTLQRIADHARRDRMLIHEQLMAQAASPDTTKH